MSKLSYVLFTRLHHNVIMEFARISLNSYDENFGDSSRRRTELFASLLNFVLNICMKKQYSPNRAFAPIFLNSNYCCAISIYSCAIDFNRMLITEARFFLESITIWNWKQCRVSTEDRYKKTQISSSCTIFVCQQC